MNQTYFFLFILFTGFPFALKAQSQNIQSENRFSKKVQLEIEVDYPYLLHIPSSDETVINGNWPLLVFLHGSGERGVDYDLLKKHGPPKIIASGKDFPFITLSPQCPLNQRWDPIALNELLKEIIHNHPVDKSRIYLTGLSMGAYGTWDWAIQYPNTFAAIAPICGGDDRNAWNAPQTISELPIWAFHGAMDNVVPVQNTINIVKRLRENGSDVKLTIYPMAGHDSWTETYNNPKLYEWFLEHSNSN